MLSQLDTALLNLLSTDVNLQTLVDDRIFAQQAPPGLTLPYIVFSWEQGGYVQNSPRLALDTTYQVEAVATDRTNAQQIAELCQTILTEQALNIAGWSHYATAAQDWQTQIENREGIQFYQIGAIYRIQADQN